MEQANTNDYPMGQAPVVKKNIIASSGNRAEVIWYERAEKQVICLTTQTSCAVGCKFCASPNTNKKTINMSLLDMQEQVMAMEKYFVDDKPIIISIMGEGEPLLNMNQVRQFMRWVANSWKHRYGSVPIKKVSVSTSMVDKKRFLDFCSFLKNEWLLNEIPFKMHFSLHAPDDDLRKHLMPLGATITTVKEMLLVWNTVLRNHELVDTEVNYMLMSGVNDTRYCVDRIIDILHFVDNQNPIHLKISDFNPIEGIPYEKSSANAFMERLLYWNDHPDMFPNGLSYERHKTDGVDVQGACGQTYANKEAS